MEFTAINSIRPLGWIRFWSLILYKTYSELRAESERTYIGYAWWGIEPILSMGVYFVVFKWILDRGTENYATFLIIGLVPWRWLSTSLQHGANAILSARSLMQQVYLPKLVLPIVSLLTDTFKFLVILVLLLVFLLFSSFPIGPYYLALPFVLAIQALLVGGLTFILAGAVPFLPDLRMVLENVVRLWLFLSGVFYPLEALPERLWIYFRMNPMLTIINSYRDILMYGRWPDFQALSVIAAGSLLLLAIGVALIHHNDYRYPKLQV